MVKLNLAGASNQDEGEKSDDESVEGEVELELGGKTYTTRLTIDALVVLKRH